MSRAYRPRLSKDKAVAQRLQDLSVERQIPAEGTLYIPESQPPAPPAAAAPPAATTAAEAAEARREAAAATETAEAIEATKRLSGDASGVLPSTPAPIPELNRGGNSNSRSRNLNRTKSRIAAAAPGTIPAATARVDAAPPLPDIAAASPQERARSRRSRSYSRQQRGVPASREAGNSSSGSRQGGWSCVSCSFLNLETAKKCRMCSTKNYQARLACSQKEAASPSPSLSPSPPASAAAAVEAPGLDNSAGGAPESTVEGVVACE